MQRSEKQIETSRLNGAKSRGPVTPMGKLNSSRNSAKHAILAETVLIHGESRERFAALMNSLTAEFLPETTTDSANVQKLAVCLWRTQRIWALESTSMNHAMRLQPESATNAANAANAAKADAPAIRAMLAFRSLTENNGRHLDLTSRYEYRNDREAHRAVQALHASLSRRKMKMRHDPGESPENKGPAKTDEPKPTGDEPAKSPL